MMKLHQSQSLELPQEGGSTEASECFRVFQPCPSSPAPPATGNVNILSLHDSGTDNQVVTAGGVAHQAQHY